MCIAHLFFRYSNLEPIAEEDSFTLPVQVWTLEQYFFELVTWGTKDDFHDIFSVLVDCAPLISEQRIFICILDATRRRR